MNEGRKNFKQNVPLTVFIRTQANKQPAVKFWSIYPVAPGMEKNR